MRTIFALLIALVAAPSVASEISMLCNNVLYRYSDPFFGKAKIEVRADASWKPICINSESISDRGGKCIRILQKSESYSVTVDESYIQNARQIAYNRLVNCRKFSRINPNLSITKKALRIAKLITHCSPEVISEFGGWDFDLNKPTNESEEFWKASDSDYYKKHLPRPGNYSGWYFADRKYRVYLDFIKLESRAVEIVNNEESPYDHRFTQCKKL